MLARALLAFLTAASTATMASAQEQHASSMDQRGAIVMGFDQAATIHHFRLFTDGGAIEVRVKDLSDSKNRDAIQSHLPHIAMMFGDGTFDAPMLVHDSKHVPGTQTMAARKAMIKYQYVATDGGGRVDIVTTDPQALAAVHDFLRFQIAEHRTGDVTTVQKR